MEIENPTLVVFKFAFKPTRLFGGPKSPSWKHSRTASSHIEMTLIGLVDLLPEGMRNCMPVVATVSVLYLTWRLWRFSISPALNPGRPRPLPYLVPCKAKNVPFLGQFC